MNSKPVSVIMGVLLIMGIAFAIWRGLNSLEKQPDWLKVESPLWVKSGESLPLQVHLLPQAKHCTLSVDLHWSKTRDDTQDFLSTGGTRVVGFQGGRFDFIIPVPPKNGLKFVKAVIYLSPNGSWYNHTQAANTELVSVSSSAIETQFGPIKALRLQELKYAPRTYQHPLMFPRIVTAFLFLMAAYLWHKSLATMDTKAKSGATTRGWEVLTLALIFSCVWELFDLETVLGDKARTLARAEDLYYTRALIQKVIISTAISATMLFLIWLFRVRPSCQFWLTCFVIYLGIATVNLISLHVIDSITTLSWHGFTLIQLLKLICATLTLYGIQRVLVANKRCAS